METTILAQLMIDFFVKLGKRTPHRRDALRMRLHGVSLRRISLFVNAEPDTVVRDIVRILRDLKQYLERTQLLSVSATAQADTAVEVKEGEQSPENLLNLAGLDATNLPDLLLALSKAYSDEEQLKFVSDVSSLEPLTPEQLAEVDRAKKRGMEAWDRMFGEQGDGNGTPVAHPVDTPPYREEASKRKSAEHRSNLRSPQGATFQLGVLPSLDAQTLAEAIAYIGKCFMEAPPVELRERDLAELAGLLFSLQSSMARIGEHVSGRARLQDLVPLATTQRRDSALRWLGGSLATSALGICREHPDAPISELLAQLPRRREHSG